MLQALRLDSCVDHMGSSLVSSAVCQEVPVLGWGAHWENQSRAEPAQKQVPVIPVC
jgi:hypothetical protein